MSVLGLVPAPPPIPLDQPPPLGGAGGGIYGKIKMKWVNVPIHTTAIKKEAAKHTTCSSCVVHTY